MFGNQKELKPFVVFYVGVNSFEEVFEDTHNTVYETLFDVI